MKKLMSLFLMGLLLLGYATVPAQGEELIPRFEPSPCPESLANLKNFECGYLVVPEDHAQPMGKTIRLAVAIAHTAYPQPAPDPVIYLAGGPGNRAVGNQANALFEQAILQERDIIYFDQRGVGLSEPSLHCPELAQIRWGGEMSGTGYSEKYQEIGIRACRDRLLSQGINLTAYTTTQSAADVAALRQVLGYESWNLWGTSYGTWLAQVVMRDHPTGIRSVILDGVSTPNGAGIDYRQAILDKLFQSCEDRLMCRLAYSQLEDNFYALVDKLNREPALVRVQNPYNGQVVKFALDGDSLLNGTLQMLTDATLIPFVPAILDQFSQGDFHQLSDLLAQINFDLQHGLAFSVLCSEFADTFCSNWVEMPTNPLDKQPVVSEIPTLLLSGAWDVLTPPAAAERIAQTLPNSYAYTFEDWGHVVLLDDCPTVIAISFLKDPSTPPQQDCTTGSKLPNFIIPVEKTRPWAESSAILMGLIVLVGVGALTLTTRHEYLAWKNSLHLIGVLPLGMSAALLLIFLGLTDYTPQDTLRVVEIIIALAIAVHSVLVFSPDNDPCLEILLTCPRRFLWALLERWGLVFILQGALAFVASVAALLITREEAVLLTLVRWIPPAVLLSGIAIYVSVRSRMAVFAITVTLIVWFALVVNGNALLPDKIVPAPFHYLQPFFWMIQPFLTPQELAGSDYLLNRLCVLLFGLNLIALAVWQLRDEERLLFGQSTRKEPLWKLR